MGVKSSKAFLLRLEEAKKILCTDTQPLASSNLRLSLTEDSNSESGDFIERIDLCQSEGQEGIQLWTCPF